MRKEFSAKVRRAALARSGGICEDVTAGYRCHSKLGPGNVEYDHQIPDQLGGQPTLENCICLCRAHHKIKTTTQDVPAIAKAKRREALHLGIKPMPATPIRSAGFRPTQKAIDRSKREPKQALPPKQLFRKA